MAEKDPADESPTGPGVAGRPTTLGLPLAVRLLFIVGAPLLGLVVGYFLPRIAAWAVTLPWLPMQGPFKLISSFDGPWVSVVCVAVGLVLGIGFTVIVFVESLKVTLTDDQVSLRKNDKTRTIERSKVSAVFADHKKLVILDTESRELARDTLETSVPQAARAFRTHGYPWVEQDPYAGLYRRWVPDTPDLSASANAVLKARETALRKKAKDDAAELRDEVQKLGFAVRDDGAKQYWRPLVRS